MKKIAIFSSFLDNIGGAEIVALTLARELDADIYTSTIDQEKIIAMGFVDVLPRIFSIGKVPKQAPFRQQLTLWRFRHLNLGKKYHYYIIAGDWAMSAGVNHHPNLWYVHSPLNELWQSTEHIQREMLKYWQQPLFRLWVWINRRLTLRYARKIDTWICNSKNTQGRIQKYYKKNAVVVYPPIYTSLYLSLPHKDYWLSVNRLTPNKRIAMQMEAFHDLPEEKLIIIGSYEKGVAQFESYKETLESIRPRNVEMRYWVSDVALKRLYAECKGFITTAHDEDFGITPVEALASGKPVIAPHEGGYKETMIHNTTGILITHITPEKLRNAIQYISNAMEKNPSMYTDQCIAQAQKFDVLYFISSIKKMLSS